VAVASSGPYASLHLAPDRQPCQHPTAQFFTGRMPFLSPNQKRQSTEGIGMAWLGIRIVWDLIRRTCLVKLQTSVGDMTVGILAYLPLANNIENIDCGQVRAWTLQKCLILWRDLDLQRDTQFLGPVMDPRESTSQLAS